MSSHMQRNKYFKTLFMSNDTKLKFNLHFFVEAIEKVEIYSKKFDNSEDFYMMLKVLMPL